MAKNREELRSIGDVKAHFAECVRAAEGGACLVLTRHGRPVARLTPYAPDESWRRAGEVGESSEVYGATEGSGAKESEFRSEASRLRGVLDLLEEEIWPRVPARLLGRAPTKKEREEILGYREEGV